MISKGADVNAKSWSGNTLLHDALRGGNKYLIVLLVSSGANVNVQNRSGNTPLHYLVGITTLLWPQVYGDRDVNLSPLFIGNFDVNAELKKIDSPLHSVTILDRKDLAEMLISRGADVNVKNRSGNTPLHLASRRGRTDMVELLITKNVDVNIKNQKGQTPLQLAQERGYKEIIELLLKHGATE
ncbi:MAG: ankyrin repeat domain-containing protein [Sedimentisphaerales bacterium]|nr:ankyrin repeat domain-containing protein [Sedimentisphaerales bacterium]